MEKLLSLKEVCDILGCKDPKGRMVRNLRSEGKLEGAKIGRNLMFTEASVRKFVEETFRLQNPKIKGRPTNRPQETNFPTNRQHDYNTRRMNYE